MQGRELSSLHSHWSKPRMCEKLCEMVKIHHPVGNWQGNDEKLASSLVGEVLLQKQVREQAFEMNTANFYDPHDEIRIMVTA